MRLALGRFFVDSKNGVWCVVGVRPPSKSSEAVYVAVRVALRSPVREDAKFGFIRSVVRGTPPALEAGFFTPEGIKLPGDFPVVSRLSKALFPEDPVDPGVLDHLASIGGE